MRRIPLSKGKVAFVDDEDYAYLSQWEWSASQNGQTFYAERWRGHGERKMHNVIMSPPWQLEVDHENGNGLDNQRHNLRMATRSQNMHNQGVRNDNTSGYKGVTWHKQHQKWMGRIRVDGRRLHLGLFDDVEEAARAYDSAAREHHGEFARLNF